jgi:hypothetical protein
MNTLELLRHIVANLHVEPLGPITQQQLDQSPFARARLTPTGNIGILRAGGEAPSDLADTIFQGAPEYLRGCTFQELSDELFGLLIQNFQGRKGPEIGPICLLEESKCRLALRSSCTVGILNLSRYLLVGSGHGLVALTPKSHDLLSPTTGKQFVLVTMRLPRMRSCTNSMRSIVVAPRNEWLTRISQSEAQSDDCACRKASVKAIFRE